MKKRNCVERGDAPEEEPIRKRRSNEGDRNLDKRTTMVRVQKVREEMERKWEEKKVCWLPLEPNQSTACGPLTPISGSIELGRANEGLLRYGLWLSSVVHAPRGITIGMWARVIVPIGVVECVMLVSATRLLLTSK